MTPNPKPSQNPNDNKAEQSNINQHEQSSFESMVNESLRCGGLHLVASKGHGKTRFLFSIADYIRTLENSRVIAFDGSLAWLYNFSQIPTFNINEADITAKDTKHTLEFEHYNFNNWQLVQTALNSHDDLLFRLKTKKPSKRGFAIRQIINYLDDQQREQIEQSETHTPLKTLSFFLEESQDCFNTRSTMRNDSEEFLSVFNEARNQKEAFFTASQRLNDFSKTIRCKQTYVIGKINSEDINPQIRRIEKLHNVDLTNLPLRNWFYNGAVIMSPEFKQHLKPFIINAEIRKEYSQTDSTLSIEEQISKKQKKGILQRIFNAFTTQSQNATYDQSEDNINEDSKGDFLALDDSELMFSEEE
jgi:hypothetical protein